MIQILFGVPSHLQIITDSVIPNTYFLTKCRKSTYTAVQFFSSTSDYSQYTVTDMDWIGMHVGNFGITIG